MASVAIKQSVGRVTSRGDVRVVGFIAGFAALVPLLGKMAGVVNPPVPLQLAVLAAAFLGTVVASRARTLKADHARAEEHDRTCSTALAAWPLPTMRDVDSCLLGVFPCGASAGRAAYVPRSIDVDLTAAIASEPFVLVVGAPGVGKSRTAGEAARAALPDALVVIPEGAVELERLVDLDPPLDPCRGTAILWLDELDRFLGPALARFVDRLAGDGRWRIVATVREDAWRRLLASSSGDGGIARRLVDRAHRFRMARRVGARDARMGFALLLVGRRSDRTRLWRRGGTAAPHAPSAPAPAPAPRLPRMTQDLPFMGSSGVLLAVVAAGICLAVLGGVTQPPTSFTDRYEKLRTEDADHRTIVDDLKPEHMRPGGQLAYVNVFRNKAGTRSDEVAVYEQVGDKPRRAMRFEPLADHGAAWLFTRRGGGFVDIDGNGRRELVGYFVRPRSADGRIPVVIFWDASQLRYRVAALVQRPAAFAGWHLTDTQHRRYVSQRTLVSTNNVVLSGYAVGAAQVVSGGGRTRLVAALYASPIHGHRDSARLAAWELGSREGEPDRARRCDVPTHAVRLTLRPDAGAERQLARAAGVLKESCA
jgi:hypothetical protein